MNRLQVATFTAVLTVLGVAGAALAVNQSSDVAEVKPPDVTATLADGQTASGGPYSISAIDTDAPEDLFCYQIATERSRGGGCSRVPTGGKAAAVSVEPRRTLLGTDRFATLFAPDDVEGMRVVGPDGERVADADAVVVDDVGRLLIATWGGPTVTSTRPDPDRTLQLLDARGEIVKELPFPGFGR